tara:strand:+ start:121 stop:618 length:498 start_codon:yes stop_codon:yes gene_type:complete
MYSTTTTPLQRTSAKTTTTTTTTSRHAFQRHPRRLHFLLQQQKLKQKQNKQFQRRVASSSGASSSSSSSSSSMSDDDAQKVQFLLNEYGHPWIENEDSALRLLDYLRTKEKREFNLEKAKAVIKQIRETHEEGLSTDEAKKANPFKLPKTFPGFLGILERSSDKI